MTQYIQPLWTSSLTQILPSSSLDAQAKELMGNLKTAMSTSNLFIITGSSNGVTGGMGFPDHLESADDFTFAQHSSSHSWFAACTVTGGVAGLPNNRRMYFFFGCSSSVSGTPAIQVSISPSNFDGGTHLVNPVSATLSKTFPPRQFLVSPVATAKTHHMWNTSGSFLFHGSATGVGRYNYITAYLKSLNHDSDDEYPFLFMQNYNPSTNGPFTPELSHNGNASAMMWKDGSLFHPTGTSYISIPMKPAAAGLIPSGNIVMAQFGVNGANATGQYPDFPAILVSVETNRIAFRGFLGDIALAPSDAAAIVQGTVEPASGSSTH